MDWIKGELLYEGKAKKVFSIADQSNRLWIEFKNSLTAFNAAKKGEFEGKGALNRNISSMIFRYLKSQGLESHWIQDVDDIGMIAEKLEMVMVEVVVRNVLAGSTAKKFGFEEGTPLERPLIELFYKDDKLGDPFLSDEQALMLKAVRDQSEIDELKQIALRINERLIPFFDRIDVRLIDFKMEFGRRGLELVLADEISPDSCRLWEKGTNEKLDKDRFRRDLGNIKESYMRIFESIQKEWGSQV